MIASASAPETRLSCAFESRAAGATHRSVSMSESPTKSAAPRSAVSPTSQRKAASVPIVPMSTSVEGSSASTSTSAMSSSAQAPRVICRTVEPAKALACHPAGRRWTRAKASASTARMVGTVRSMTAK